MAGLKRRAGPAKALFNAWAQFALQVVQHLLMLLSRVAHQAPGLYFWAPTASLLAFPMLDVPGLRLHTHQIAAYGAHPRVQFHIWRDNLARRALMQQALHHRRFHLALQGLYNALAGLHFRIPTRLRFIGAHMGDTYEKARSTHGTQIRIAHLAH
jgi:hypothetical protein